MEEFYKESLDESQKVSQDAWRNPWRNPGMKLWRKLWRSNESTVLKWMSNYPFTLNCCSAERQYQLTDLNRFEAERCLVVYSALVMGEMFNPWNKFRCSFGVSLLVLLNFIWRVPTVPLEDLTHSKAFVFVNAKRIPCKHYSKNFPRIIKKFFRSSSRHIRGYSTENFWKQKYCLVTFHSGSISSVAGRYFLSEVQSAVLQVFPVFAGIRL